MTRLPWCVQFKVSAVHRLICSWTVTILTVTFQRQNQLILKWVNDIISPVRGNILQRYQTKFCQFLRWKCRRWINKCFFFLSWPTHWDIDLNVWWMSPSPSSLLGCSGAATLRSLKEWVDGKMNWVVGARGVKGGSALFERGLSVSRRLKWFALLFIYLFFKSLALC